MNNDDDPAGERISEEVKKIQKFFAECESSGAAHKTLKPSNAQRISVLNGRLRTLVPKASSTQIAALSQLLPNGTVESPNRLFSGCWKWTVWVLCAVCTRRRFAYNLPSCASSNLTA